ncbi:tol-pal system YbgF family protein [Muriicola sp. SD30]|uniref:tetratricopeptide repeat protein n=1 Tax=Muriicola sp. SD30 TaxID=3240936 RepID=UPI0035101807
MKNILLAVLMCLINPLFGQNSEIEKLLVQGNDAYQKSDFANAKVSYEAIIKIDSNNKDALYNLAGTELNLGNKSHACDLLQKSYSLGDIGAYDLIKEYCNELNYSEKMFLFQVDELPKFLYKNEFVPLVINRKELNPLYLKLIREELIKSKEFKRIKGQARILLNVDINGNLITKIAGEIPEDKRKLLGLLLGNMTEYKPATYMNKSVGLFGGGFALPLTF